MPLPINDITAKFVRSIFDFDDQKVVLVWKKSVSQNRTSRGGNSRPGKIAGRILTNGYQYIRLNHRWYLAHRLIFLYKNGKWPPNKIDHPTGNRADNSKIRLADDSQNSFNRSKDRRNTSGFKGVSWHGQSKKWRAQITAYGKYKSLGLYFTKEEAYAAYCKAAKELHGKFANLG